MGFQQGLSGLNASAKHLDVIGNNVANVNTVGFKGSRAEFADIYASTFGTASNIAGIGARVTTISQQFSQGNTTSTNNPLDIAITGNGFFRMQDTTGSISYARNGQFQLDKNGYIVNNGQFLTGWGVDQGTGIFLQGSTPQPIQLQFSNIGARATGASGVTGAGLNLGLNLNAADKVIPAGTAFSSSDPTTYNYSTSATVYDSLGVAHTQTMYFRKQDPAAGGTVGTWDVKYNLDGKDVLTSGALGVPSAGDPLFGTTLTFDANGKPVGLPVGGSTFNVTAAALNNGSSGLNYQMYFDTSTQFGSPYNVNTLTQDGYTDGVLTGISVSKDGVVQGRYSNGQSRNVAKVVLSTFNNAQGLQPLGDNRWAESFASGQPLTNGPGQGNTGLLQAAAVEDSNVDLTAELVNLITAQRNYQANAQSVKAQDTIMQTIVNLR
ncbi:flagellar hook protein FlgE [Chitinibacter bivalviorum]|uniref:Flagellar hook protein FlgE n=1 Tax=Chitinibacter bivalviorum TaxID=2739434 RepID=A0A7H9BHM6_9NEIS|nr:flagellar hook protein FlgE [Chitinibacter bivalviorum]QLG88137.1 flagellar hook protein FlgE [Chitinibacter bivalviorum]